MNTYFITIGIIAIIIIITIIFYKFYYIPKTSNTNKYAITLLTGPTTFKESFQQIIQIASLISSRQTLYIPYLEYGLTFSWEMYVPVISGNSQWQSSNNQTKPILSINDSPQIGYQPHKNILSIVVKYRNSPTFSKFAELNYNQVKCQTWVKYTVVISSNSIILYENANIVKVKALDSVPILYDIGNQIKLGQLNNNCLSKFMNFTMYPYPLSYSEVKSI